MTPGTRVTLLHNNGLDNRSSDVQAAILRCGCRFYFINYSAFTVSKLEAKDVLPNIKPHAGQAAKGSKSAVFVPSDCDL